MAPKKFVKSTIWNSFKKKPNADRIAICNICELELSFKSTVSNLRKHMNRKHSVKISLPDPPCSIDAVNKDNINIPGTKLKVSRKMDSNYSKKFTKSFIWSKFSKKPNSDKIAICDICEGELSFKSTTNNLKKHLIRKHPLIRMPLKSDLPKIKSERNQTNYPLDLVISESNIKSERNQTNCPLDLVISESKVIQAPVNDILIEADLKEDCNKKIDDALMLLFTNDLQPFSIVQDIGFKKLIKTLNPNYELPSKRTITDVLLPEQYKEVYSKTTNLINSAKSVTLTVDRWLSSNKENFMTVTAHFLNENFEHYSLLLDCVSFDSNVNLAVNLKSVYEEWNLKDKILVVITSSDIKNSVEELQLKHLECYAHIINMIALNALKSCSKTLDKVKIIVAFFRRNTTAMSKLIDQQIKLGKEANRLVQHVETRWNSTYYMIERFVMLEESLKMTIALLNEDFPVICVEEWKFMKELLLILKPLECITSLMSVEKYVTASNILVLTYGLISAYHALKQQSVTHFSINVINIIIDEVIDLINFEQNDCLIVSTFLDPRFKIIGFSNESVVDRAKKRVLELLSTQIELDFPDNVNNAEINRITSFLQTEYSIWGYFDKKVASLRPNGTAYSKAIIEVQRYLEDPPISREEDPLLWWKNNAYNFPQLAKLVKEKFVPVATSTPCNKFFSKTGQILLERRNRLNSAKIKQLLFINHNSFASDYYKQNSF